MISTLLIANRGEIACRIIRTARRLGIRTVAVYSDADARSLHVREADDAIHIGPSAVRESYLAADRILAAAKDSGADAIHPGYGFLSEDADFAEAVIAAGLVWVGPQPAAIRIMGRKDAAKTLMANAGVPVTPGYMGERQDPGFLAARAEEIGYPVLIKAVAGGGGKGMRLVERASDFADALGSCRREAASSFGNADVLLETYIQRPRHIEVQLFGDTHGNIVHLFERDCSLQRRHQKVIEEAPAPGMDDATRADLCATALRAAQAVDYVGAGTIEFIADTRDGLRADRIWFMEMNTRLQVEHPVTEEITGVDLVEWQLRIASGERLPKLQEELAISGWAIEARLYAEDPSTGFLPSTGTLELLRFGDAPGARIETGVHQGAEVSPFYDPMIAKLVARGTDRDEARDRLRGILAGTAVWPVKTNASFLLNALDHPAFVAGDVDTGMIARDIDVLAALPPPSSAELSRAAMALVPNFDQPGFRLNPAPVTTAIFLLDGEPAEVRIEGGCANPAPSAFVAQQGRVQLLTPWRVEAEGETGAASGAILAPMPGRIIAVAVAAGDRVTNGQKLLTLEAMKMEHSLTAPFDGVVVELAATIGAQVELQALLARIDKEEP